MKRKGNGQLFFDPISGSLDDIHTFLDTLDCPRFCYKDVLNCYSSMIAQHWVEDPVPESTTKQPPKPSYTPEPARLSASSDSDQDEIETGDGELTPQVTRAKPRTNHRSTFGQRWSKLETDALLRGLERFGWGRWQKICDSEPILRDSRNFRQCCDRAKWLKRSGQLKL